jgi:hypothetical protein
MPKFLTPINLSNLELQNVLLQNTPTSSLPVTLRAGQILYDSTVHRPVWSNGSLWNYIYRASTTHVDSEITTVIRDTSGNFSAGTITAALSGNATTATTLQNGRNIGISGTKVTATAANFNGSTDVNINITALSVVPGDIALANGSFIVGNGSTVGAATAKNLIPISGFGAATANVSMGDSFRITNLADPQNPQDAATKAYVDTFSQGLDPKESCHLATEVNLAATYTSGNQRLTGTVNGGLTVDSVPVVAGDRILVRSQTTATQNGIYVVTQAGDAYTPFILTRAADFNTSAKASPGSFVFIENGSVYADTGWVMSSDAVVTLDTSNINWVQFSGAGSYSAGRGLVQVGSQFHFAQSTAYAVGDIFYASGASSITPLAAAATNNALISNGAGVAPSWGKISTATLAQIAGLSILGNTANSTANVDQITGTANQVLRVNAAGNALGFGSINLANAAAVTGILPIDNGGTGLNAVGAQYTVLSSNGSAASWTSVNLNNMTSGTLPVAKGGTGSTFFTVAGPTATRTFTFKDQNATVPTFFATTITGDNSTVAFTVTHNLNTRDVIIAVNESATPWARVYTDDEATSTTTATVKFAVAPPTGTNYRVVVVGF